MSLINKWFSLRKARLINHLKSKAYFMTGNCWVPLSYPAGAADRWGGGGERSGASGTAALHRLFLPQPGETDRRPGLTTPGAGAAGLAAALKICLLIFNA